MRAAVLICVALTWAHVVPGVLSDDLVGRWVYLAAVLGSALLCARRARGMPWVWGALAIGLLAKAAGDLVYSLAGDIEAVPVPSASDPLWLAIYPCAYVALVGLSRRRTGRVAWATRLDGLICGLSVGALLAWAMIPGAQQGMGGASVAEQVTTMAYPLGDVVLFGGVVMALAVGGWRVDATLGVLGASVLATIAANLLYLYGAADTAGRVADALALTGVACLGIVPSFTVRLQRDTRDRGILLPVGFGAVALAVTALAEPLGIPGAAVGAAVAALALTLVRTALVVREHRDMLAQSRMEAGTDPLTRLANRRRLGRDLDTLLAEGSPHALIVFDLNGFKAYNDTFGHGEGDELLVDIGARLVAALGVDGTAYRLGGDEFCALTPCPPEEIERVARRCVDAMAHRVGAAEISAAYGAVALPGAYPDGAAAIAAADALMYEHKRARAPVSSA
jgi:diguanylate cyclase (GGDEF)-like protein